MVMAMTTRTEPSSTSVSAGSPMKRYRQPAATSIRNIGSRTTSKPIASRLRSFWAGSSLAPSRCCRSRAACSVRPTYPSTPTGVPTVSYRRVAPACACVEWLMLFPAPVMPFSSPRTPAPPQVGYAMRMRRHGLTGRPRRALAREGLDFQAALPSAKRGFQNCRGSRQRATSTN